MLLEQWLSDLAYIKFPHELYRAGDSIGTRPYASEIEEMLEIGGGISASAVFCVGEVPTVCFIDSQTLQLPRQKRVEQICQRVWNQNLASVVLVLDPDGLVAYSVNDREAEPEVLSREAVVAQGYWSAYEVQSGFIKDRLSHWFLPEERVDQRLLANLRQVVKQLAKEGLGSSQAEALMAQVIFLCYLEQRGIVGEGYRATHNLERLEDYVAKSDGEGVDSLLRQLKFDFNGDFLSSRDGGAPDWVVLNEQCFRCIKRFLEAVDFETGQGAFWQYDFSHIPVELISGIYETLLKDRQGALGAYYTPRHLASLVTEQAFESFDNPAGCTVYDGACGSGILLTSAFRKMLRHAEVSGGRRLTFSERVALMESNLFGNDIDETACWITAFSLYLSLLEGLDSEEVMRLQTDNSLKLPRLVGSGLNIQKGELYGDFFSEDNPFSGKRKFDILLSNPPWRESDNSEKPVWEEWCRKHVPPYPVGRRQIAAGYAFKATSCVKVNSVIVLIMPLNLVIGASDQSGDFRRRWLEDVRIERIINFADVRRLLFPAAKHPCAVVRARPRSFEDEIISLGSEYVEYWAPKTDVTLALGRLALHEADKKIISAKEIYQDNYLLISSYWGEKRDQKLLRRLQRFGSVKETMESRESPWLSGKGFHAANHSNRDRELGVLADLSLMPADRLPRVYPIVSADAQLARLADFYPIVASPGGKNAKLYSGPRVIFPDGLSESYVIRAIYSEVPFAFTSSIGAIGGASVDANLLKFLMIYLRSPIATYMLIMTGYSVIGERPRVAIDDVERFPFCSPEAHKKPELAKEIIFKSCQLLDKISAESELHRESAYDAVKVQLDNLVFDYFMLAEAERVLITDTVDVIASSIQPSNYQGLTTPLLDRPSNDEIDRYLTVFKTELALWRSRSRGAGELTVEAVIDGAKGFFGAVRVSVGESSTGGLNVADSAYQRLIGDLYAGLEANHSVESEGKLFNVPNILVAAGEAFYFVKPLRRRFWLARTALADADLIVQTVQAAAWGRN